MNCALLFNNDGSKQLVTAEEVKAGIYNRYEYEFVDPEYEFKVQFVKGSKNNGKPYFRLYYSYEDFKQLFPDRADRYKILTNMRRYDESMWHKTWKQRVSAFCEIEKCFKNPETNKWKFADAYNSETNTCIEFQHSYIAFDFEERNQFYSCLGINTIWLYDLPDATTRKRDDGCIEILEDNSKGFFRISEKPDNLKNYQVYIQVKGGAIYRVTQLDRLPSDSDYKSSIRYFPMVQEFDEDSFIDFLRTNKSNAFELRTLHELWNPNYAYMVVENTTNGDTIMINTDRKGNMFYSFISGFIQYKYVTCSDKNGETVFSVNKNKDYSLSRELEKARIWRLITYREYTASTSSSTQ